MDRKFAKAVLAVLIGSGVVACRGLTVPAGALSSLSPTATLSSTPATAASPSPTPTTTALSPVPTDTSSSPSSTATSPTTTSPISSSVYSCTISSLSGTCPASGSYDDSIQGGDHQAADVTQDAWNPTSALVSQALSASSMSRWQVRADLSAGNTAVLSYPDAQDTLTDSSNNPVPLSDFASLTSTYATQMPSDAGTAGPADDYEAAYDIWLGHNGADYNQEIMVWTDNHNQTPAGSDTGTTWTDPSTGVAYEVWANSGNNPVTLVRKSNTTSGSVDLLSLFSWLRSAGYSTETGVNQIDYGFELCSTSGHTETFTVTGYTLDATCASGTSC
jgi:hypothetical protein